MNIIIRKIIKYIKTKLLCAIRILLLIILHHLFLQLHHICIKTIIYIIVRIAFVFPTSISSFLFRLLHVSLSFPPRVLFSLYFCNFAKWYVYIFSLYLYFIKTYILFTLYWNYCITFSSLRDPILKLTNYHNC